MNFSNTLISGLINPSYGAELGKAAGLLGGLPRTARENQVTREQRDTLAGLDLANSPEDLRKAAAIAQRQGNQQLAQKYAQDARALLQDRQKAAREADEARAGRGVQGGLSAITQAARRGVKFEDLSEAISSVTAQGGSAEDIREAYEAGLPENDTADRYRTVGNRVFDNQLGVFISPEESPEAVESLKIKDLKGIATPESIIKYVKSGNTEDLQFLKAEGEGEATEESTKSIVSEINQLDSLLQTVEEAAGLGEDVWPVFYDVAQYAPSSDARKLKNRISTLQSNQAFDRLQRMRDESKTGGALGQVSNIELDLLKNSLTSLDPGAGDFAQQLQKVKDQYTRFKDAVLGKMPSGDKYISMDGRLYYQDEDGNFIDLGEL